MVIGSATAFLFTAFLNWSRLGSPKQLWETLARTPRMHIYTSLQLTSLLIAGLTINSPKFGYPSQKLKQPDPVQQHLLAEASDKGCGDTDSSDSGQSDSRGSQRRDK